MTELATTIDTSRVETVSSAALKATDPQSTATQNHDKELDDLIFAEKQKENQVQEQSNASMDTEKPVSRKSSTESEMAPEDEEAVPKKKNSFASRASLTNVIPVDRLKNGASTASNLIGSTYSKLKEKGNAGWQSAKSSQAGNTLSSGITKASEQLGKVKDTETYKKTTSLASSAYDKVKSNASAGFEKARTTASTSFETVRSKAHSVTDSSSSDSSKTEK